MRDDDVVEIGLPDSLVNFLPILRGHLQAVLSQDFDNAVQMLDACDRQQSGGCAISDLMRAQSVEIVLIDRTRVVSTRIGSFIGAEREWLPRLRFGESDAESLSILSDRRLWTGESQGNLCGTETGGGKNAQCRGLLLAPTDGAGHVRRMQQRVSVSMTRCPRIKKDPLRRPLAGQYQIEAQLQPESV
jgi:hypothetical protein